LTSILTDWLKRTKIKSIYMHRVDASFFFYFLESFLVWANLFSFGFGHFLAVIFWWSSRTLSLWKVNLCKFMNNVNDLKVNFKLTIRRSTRSACCFFCSASFFILSKYISRCLRSLFYFWKLKYKFLVKIKLEFKKYFFVYL